MEYNGKWWKENLGQHVASNLHHATYFFTQNKVYITTWMSLKKKKKVGNLTREAISPELFIFPLLNSPFLKS